MDVGAVVSITFGVIMGLIVYFEIKDRNEKEPRNQAVIDGFADPIDD